MRPFLIKFLIIKNAQNSVLKICSISAKIFKRKLSLIEPIAFLTLTIHCDTNFVSSLQKQYCYIHVYLFYIIVIALHTFLHTCCTSNLRSEVGPILNWPSSDSNCDVGSDRS